MEPMPDSLLEELPSDELEDVRAWWTLLTDHDRVLIVRMVSVPEHEIRLKLIGIPDELLVEGDSSEWEDDWREFLTEHPDVKISSQLFKDRSYKLLEGLLNIHVSWDRVDVERSMLPPSEIGLTRS